jgi:hypothetical protein
MMARRREVAGAVLLGTALVIALVASIGRSRRQATQLVQQRLDDAGGLWAVPNSIADDDDEVQSGRKVLNRGHISWYWVPPTAEPLVQGLPRRLDASGRVAGDPHSPKVWYAELAMCNGTCSLFPRGPQTICFVP